MPKQLTKAMILAAGFGKRLRPITDQIPKALVKVNGKPMIEHVMEKLIASGIKEVVVNTHHFQDQLEEYFSKKKFAARVHLIPEKEILGTGGGIKNAAAQLRDSGNFLVHNVDIFSDVSIRDLYDYHSMNSPLVTLAVQDRESNRQLIFDEDLNLLGRQSPAGEMRYKTNKKGEILMGFCGIHIISSSIFDKFSEAGFFDIFTSYFRLVGQGEKIIAYNAGSAHWQDLGNTDAILKRK